MSLRPVDPQDPGIAARLLALQQRSYAVEAALIGYPALPPLQETLDDLRVDTARFFSIWQDDELIAALSLDDQAEPPCITRLMVDPAHFGKGHASRLLGEVLMRGIPLEVGTAAANEPARRLYEKHGFRLLETFRTPDGLALVVYGHKGLR